VFNVAIAAGTLHAFITPALRAELAKLPEMAFFETAEFPDWWFWETAARCVFNAICAVALFRWKKWGFYGLLASGLAGRAGDIALGANLIVIASGFCSLFVLYVILQVEAKKSRWPQPE
jgi:hypothetical protein